MTRNVHVVAVSGSLADDSGTRTTLREALTAAERAGARTTLVDLREYDLPTFDADGPDAGTHPRCGAGSARPTRCSSGRRCTTGRSARP